MANFFGDGGGDDMKDLTEGLWKGMFTWGRMLLRAFQPTVNNIRSLRDQAAVRQASQQQQKMLQQSQGQPENPAASQPYVARADLSPPRRKQ